MIVRTAEEARVWRAQLEKALPAVPDYEYWGNNVKVNGRVWIKVR